MSTELATRKAEVAFGNTPHGFDDAWRMATAIQKSGLAPSSFKTAESILVAMQYGAELGMKPMQSLQGIAVINGKPSLYGDALMALVLDSGKCELLKEHIEGTGENAVAVCESKRKDHAESRVTRFSVADAKKAQLWDKAGPWKQYPLRMLTMRARAFNLRDNFADVLRGMTVAEEVQDIPQPPSGGRELKLSEIADEPTAPDPEVIDAEIEAADTPDMDAILEALNNCKTPSQVKEIETYWDGHAEVASLCKSRLELMTVQKKKSGKLIDDGDNTYSQG